MASGSGDAAGVELDELARSDLTGSFDQLGLSRGAVPVQAPDGRRAFGMPTVPRTLIRRKKYLTFRFYAGPGMGERDFTLPSSLAGARLGGSCRPSSCGDGKWLLDAIYKKLGQLSGHRRESSRSVSLCG